MTIILVILVMGVVLEKMKSLGLLWPFSEGKECCSAIALPCRLGFLSSTQPLSPLTILSISTIIMQ
ncbi:hypothetical protein [Phormidium nigroviride]